MVGRSTGEPGPAVGAAMAVVPRSVGASTAAMTKAILEVVLRLRSKGVPSFAGMLNGAPQWPGGTDRRGIDHGNGLTP
ncbi:hypothetical protein GCM10010298_36490 [Streptomyces microflavus]|nr:hypothetical protein GCM10010298_36490 [Streptomyces microflavus]